MSKKVLRFFNKRTWIFCNAMEFNFCHKNQKYNGKCALKVPQIFFYCKSTPMAINALDIENDSDEKARKIPYILQNYMVFPENFEAK